MPSGSVACHFKKSPSKSIGEHRFDQRS
ncbi:hypothetical protein C347_03741 [Cryptococcus neoformans AD2-60a]|nr:hypothetical protein C347_03742 [Cryptococcus neoformans var. grubii AD2-60a]OWZ31244.1 hypothetical protein C347_03741 [Cryptococcus neoformans var. grubii AD2-60a]OXH09998.1 hypothetical protein C369_03562 [Cryptococcus neoformans var. grubii A5-35-17]OXH31798.1 hypothetical protein J005_03527 [Cryptococcus neoformans var. grubii]